MEKLVVFLKHLTRAFEQFYAVSEGIGDIHVSTVDPELAVCALGDLVVQDNEVTNVLKFNLRLTIEFVYFSFLDTVMREMLDESSQSGLYQMDAG